MSYVEHWGSSATPSYPRKCAPDANSLKVRFSASRNQKNSRYKLTNTTKSTMSMSESVAHAPKAETIKILCYYCRPLQFAEDYVSFQTKLAPPFICVIDRESERLETISREESVVVNKITPFFILSLS